MSIGYFNRFAVDDIISFVHNNPQGERVPNYFFIGGTAVRLHQEFNGDLIKNYASSLENRPMSDVDIMTYSRTTLPVDTFHIDADSSFDWSNGIPDWIISSLSCKGTSIFVASPALTIGSKIVMTDAPRKKDYEDYLRLESLLDVQEMSEVFKRATHMRDYRVATNLYTTMASTKGVAQEHYFRCLREAANLLSRHPQVHGAIDHCFQDENMDSTMVNRVVLHHLNVLLNKAHPSYSSDLAMKYVQFCKGRNLIELDRLLSKSPLSNIKTCLQQL